MVEFKRAERKAAKLKVLLSGISGSGKTTSALYLARGIVGPKGKIAVIDTEYGSAEMNSEQTEFDTYNLPAPYSPKAYMEAMDVAIEAGYDIIVIDGMTPAWQYVTSEVDKLNDIKDLPGNWAKGRKTSGGNAYIEHIRAVPVDVICTVHAKELFDVSKGDRGKLEIKRLGLGPEYGREIKKPFDLSFMLADNNTVTLDKNRTTLWKDGVPFVITPDHGETLRKWRDEGGEFVEPMAAGTRSKIKEYIKGLGHKLELETLITVVNPILEANSIEPLKEKLGELSEKDAKVLRKELKKAYDKETNDG